MLVAKNALVVVQNNGKDMYNYDAGANLFFFFVFANWELLILLLFSLPSPFSSTRFYFFVYRYLVNELPF